MIECGRGRIYARQIVPHTHLVAGRRRGRGGEGARVQGEQGLLGHQPGFRHKREWMQVLVRPVVVTEQVDEEALLFVCV